MSGFIDARTDTHPEEIEASICIVGTDLAPVSPDTQAVAI